MRKINIKELPKWNLRMKELEELVRLLGPDEALELEPEEFPGHSPNLLKRAANAQTMLRRTGLRVVVKWHEPSQRFYIFPA